MFPLEEGEKITVVLPLTGEMRAFPADRYVFMATAGGTVKKTALNEFSNPRKAGIIAVGLDEGDYLIGAALTAARPCALMKTTCATWAARPVACAA